MIDLPIETLLACIAAVLLYIPTFMVAYDRFETWTSQPVVAADATVTDIAAPGLPGGLAAEPTTLPRSVLGLGHGAAGRTPARDDFMPALVARLDLLPSTNRTATA